MTIEMRPIGFVTEADPPPEEGKRFTDRRERLRIEPEFQEGLTGLEPGRKVQILFYFHLSEGYSNIAFSMKQQIMTGVFNTRCPRRPNGIGVTVAELLAREGGELLIGGGDMLPGTPILDIKPYDPEPKK